MSETAAVEPGLVSTVIPYYNRPAYLREAVESVLKQSYRPIEIVLSDDGSTGSSLAEVVRLAREHWEIVRVVRNPNRGPGPAREAGRQIARGEYIQYLDSDDRLHPEKFARQVRALREHPECGIAYGRTRLIDEAGGVIEAFYKRIERRDYLFPGLLVDRWWCTHTPLYRREMCDRIGAWSDLRFSQDWEYDARFGALRTKLVFVDHVVSDHRDHSAPERQTGRGCWLEPADQVRFFEALYGCATQAGVAPGEPEMRHFVRWVFAAARSAGTTGDVKSAGWLLGLARRAHVSALTEMVAYGWAARILGWQNAARLTDALRRLLNRRVGRHTRPQAWMK